MGSSAQPTAMGNEFFVLLFAGHPDFWVTSTCPPDGEAEAISLHNRN